MTEESKEAIKYLKNNIKETKAILKGRLALNEAIYYLVKEVRDKFVCDLNIEVKKRMVNNEISIEISIEIQQGDYLFSGDFDKSFGLGFIVKKDNMLFNYGGTAYGGCGKGLTIKEKDAHYGTGIEETNLILIEANDTNSWKEIVSDSAKFIMKQVKEAEGQIKNQ